MPDPRTKPDRDPHHAARSRRRERALVVEYLHELSDRHSRPARANRAAPERESLDDGGEERG
jgi:hypothetical protein